MALHGKLKLMKEKNIFHLQTKTILVFSKKFQVSVGHNWHQLVKDYQTFKQITIITGVTLQSDFNTTSLLICSVLKVSQQVFC